MTKLLMDTWHWKLQYWVAHRLSCLSDAVSPRCFRKKDLEGALSASVKPLFPPEIYERDRPTIH